MLIHLEGDACLMTGRAAAEMVPSVLAVGSRGGSTVGGIRLLLWCPFYPSVPFHPWALERVSRASCKAVTTLCLPRVLLVGKGLVRMFSFNTKSWSDRITHGGG